MPVVAWFRDANAEVFFLLLLAKIGFRELLAAASLVFTVVCFSPASFAQDQMPPKAPDIHSAPATSTAFGESEVPVFTRTVSPAPQREPLSGNVSRIGLTNPASGLQGIADYMVNVPPGISAGTNVNVPAETFHAWLENAHPMFAMRVSQNDPGEVVEVKGAWDDAGKTLRKLGIPSSRIKGGDLRDYPLDKVKVLIINCAGTVPRDTFQRIRDFVMRGGYLLTTDWALDNMLQKTFPGYVEWNHKQNKRAIYDSEVTSPDPVLFRNTVAHANWKLDNESHLIAVVKPDAVRILVRSNGLAREDGQGILAVTFPFGRGQVLHMVGHFDNNPVALFFRESLPDPAPVIGISLRQAIAANFVVAGMTRTAIPTR